MQFLEQQRGFMSVENRLKRRRDRTGVRVSSKRPIDDDKHSVATAGFGRGAFHRRYSAARADFTSRQERT